MNYKQYLKSDHWQEIKNNFPRKKCFICGEKSLDIHHKTYKRIGKENIKTDLVYLCRECHKATHIFLNKYMYPGMNIFNAAGKLKKHLGNYGHISTKDRVNMFIRQSANYDKLKDVF